MLKIIFSSFIGQLPHWKDWSINGKNSFGIIKVIYKNKILNKKKNIWIEITTLYKYDMVNKSINIEAFILFHQIEKRMSYLIRKYKFIIKGTFITKEMRNTSKQKY